MPSGTHNYGVARDGGNKREKPHARLRRVGHPKHSLRFRGGILRSLDFGIDFEWDGRQIVEGMIARDFYFAGRAVFGFEFLFGATLGLHARFFLALHFFLAFLECDSGHKYLLELGSGNRNVRATIALGRRERPLVPDSTAVA